MIPNAYIEDEIDEKDWIFGTGDTLGSTVRKGGDWRLFYPKFEMQMKNGLETLSCVTFTTLNAIEVLFDQKYKIKSDFSERYTAKVSGTTKTGNSPQFVAQSVRHFGVIPEDVLPFSPDINTWDEFYSDVPEDLYKMGRGWLGEWVFNHQWVPPEKEAMLDALTFSPLGVAVHAWREDHGIYYRPDGAVDTHLTLLVGGDDNFWYVFDSYPPYVKKLDKNYTFNRVKRYHIARQSESSFRDRLRQLIDTMRGLLKIR